MPQKNKEEANAEGIEAKVDSEQAEAKVKKAKKQSKNVSISREEFDKLREDAQKADENWQQYLRQVADLENFRKRKEKERQEYIKYANESLIAEIIPIMDNFELAFSAAEKNPATHNFAVGVEMILGQMKELLKTYGAEEINPDGEKFDPNFHDAVERVESDEYECDMVVEVMKKGYMLNGRVLQPATVKVAVANGKAQPQSEEKRDENAPEACSFETVEAEEASDMEQETENKDKK